MFDERLPEPVQAPAEDAAEAKREGGADACGLRSALEKPKGDSKHRRVEALERDPLQQFSKTPDEQASVEANEEVRAPLAAPVATASPAKSMVQDEASLKCDDAETSKAAVAAPGGFTIFSDEAPSKTHDAAPSRSNDGGGGGGFSIFQDDSSPAAQPQAPKRAAPAPSGFDIFDDSAASASSGSTAARDAPQSAAAHEQQSSSPTMTVNTRFVQSDVMDMFNAPMQPLFAGDRSPECDRAVSKPAAPGGFTIFSDEAPSKTHDAAPSRSNDGGGGGGFSIFQDDSSPAAQPQAPKRAAPAPSGFDIFDDSAVSASDKGASCPRSRRV